MVGNWIAKCKKFLYNTFCPSILHQKKKRNEFILTIYRDKSKFKKYKIFVSLFKHIKKKKKVYTNAFGLIQGKLLSVTVGLFPLKAIVKFSHV